VKIATLGNAAVVHTQRWVRWFRSRGHEVRLWSLERGPADLDVQPLPRLPLPGFVRYPLAALALRRSLRAYAPDVVDAHYVPNYGLLGALAAVSPLVVTAWGSDLLVAAPRDPLQRTRARFVLRRAAAVVADSQNLGAAARALGADPNRVHVVPWGVDLDRFASGAHREPGLLLSVRMHEPIYDLPTLLRGVAPVLSSRPYTRLAIAGDGRLRLELERMAARLLPAGSFQFLGKLEARDLIGLLQRAEIYLSASRSDSTSLSLLEAMACGAIPVVSDLEGNREWVSEADGARLFPCGDADGLTAAVMRALDDPRWCERARVRNRRVVEARGDMKANMTRIESLLASAAGTRATR
jgi:glycosyltransferase involved in cell wall biosynthesis